MNQYKLNYSQKGVKRVAPDSFVLINRSPYLTSAVTGEQFAFHNDIQSITINANLHSPPAGASFVLSVTRSEEDKYFSNGKCIIKCMMEVKFYIKGRYYLAADDGTVSAPKPIQQFWGVITSVSDEYSGDKHTITIECQDMLYWMKIMKMNLHPSVLTATSVASVVTPFRSAFERTTAKDIIVKLVNAAFGSTSNNKDQVIFNSAYVADTFNSRSFTLGLNTRLFNSQTEFNDIEATTIADYWKNRFQISNARTQDTNFLNLMIYGYQAQLNPSQDKTIAIGSQSQSEKGSNATSQPQEISRSNIPIDTEQINSFYLQQIQQVQQSGSTTPPTGTTGPDQIFDEVISNAQPFGQLAQVPIVHSEYTTLLDIATQVKEYIGYEFYMSLDGDVLFKPPFYNLDVKPYRPLVIKDDELVSFSIKETDDVITQMTARGSLHQILNSNNEIVPTGTSADPGLMRQFFLRPQIIDVPMASTAQSISQSDFLSIYAQNQMDIHNAKRRNGTIVMVGTPEIKLGYPVYIESRDCYAYVVGINHSFTFGAQYQTTLTLEAFRYQSDDGAVAVMKPGVEDAETTNDTTSPLKQQFINAEGRGAISGSGTKLNFTRQVSTKGASDDPTKFYSNQIQQLSDLDGYECVGTISYGRDLMIGPSGEFLFKINPLNFDTTATSSDVTRKANSLSNIDATSTTPPNVNPETTYSGNTSGVQPANVAAALSNMSPSNVKQ